MTTHRQELVARITSELGTGRRGLQEVAGAADVAAVLQGRISPSSVFVIKASSRRDDNGRTVTHTDQYLVLIVVRNVRDSRGADASDAAEDWSHRVEVALKGFEPQVPDGRFLELKLVRGSVQRWTDQLLIWTDVYQLTFARRCC